MQRHPQEVRQTETLNVSLIAEILDCGKHKDLQRGIILHANVVAGGCFKHSSFVRNAVISMYVKCGALDMAREVFDALPICNDVSWNTMISGYAVHNYGQVAIDCYHRMLVESLLPNSVTYTGIFKACSVTGSLKNGQIFHSQIFKERLLERHIIVGNALVHMYAKCGVLDKAQEAFDGLRFQSVISWTALIAGCVQFKKYEEALHLFEQMQLAGFFPDAVTFACILKACSCLGALEKGQEVHAQIVREYLHDTKNLITNALLDMYMKCGAVEKAQDVFVKLSIPSLVSWTTLIAGYAEQGVGEDALEYFRKLQSSSHCPDAVMFACILKACGSVRDLNRGKEIHAQILTNHSAVGHKEVGNALVSMYAKCGAFDKALEVFGELQARDEVSWNALIAGYMRHGRDEEALACFAQMGTRGFSPSKVTFASILKACGNMGCLERGQDIHAQIARKFLLEKHTVIVNSLVGMYANCGALEKAQEVFDDLSVRETVAWTMLMTGYAEHEHEEQAFACFEKMQYEGIFPDGTTFACILKACGTVGALVRGQNIHTEIVRNGLLDQDFLLGLGLVVMYANCGMLEEAQQIFNEVTVRDVALWSALIAGYGQEGKDKVVFSLFEAMCKEGIRPDSLTFTIILSTCCRKGLVDEGCAYLEMAKSQGLVLSTEHYSCMIDLLSRAGYPEVAAAVTEEVPTTHGTYIWQSLLISCQKMADTEISEWAFDCAIHPNESIRLSA